MNKKQETDLKIISRIDDEIIEKNSKKRYELLTRKKIKKWIIPSSVAAIILVAIMVPILILLFAKQVPVYEGMTVSKYKPVSSAENVAPEMETHRFSFLSNTNGNNGNGNGDNGNHNGHNKKPVDEIIEEDTSIGIEVPEQPMYYAGAGQEIYITVHISNPDSFEILSFTLNGKKYSSYMFEEGSDMENLILKVTVPANAEGVIDYTIDAIKYVDGTDIKDVDMRGERTVKVGVSTSKQPEATVSDELIRINDVSFNVTLSDGLGLIERCGGKAFAVIVDGDSILSYEEIIVGDEHITFEGLETYTSYRYGVVAYYDALDGNGMDIKILFEKEFTTQSVVAPDNIVKTQTSIEFGLIFNELYEEKNVTSMSLYHGEDKVKDFDLSGDVATKTFSATELLSNNAYTVVISYTNAGATETVEFKVTTEAKATPDFEITETEKTQTSFKFDIAITDVDAVGAITKIELVHGEDVTNVEDLTARELTNLLSNNDYTLKVTYTYDLNDGVGDQTLVKELAVKTEAKAVPDFTITETEKTQTSFKFDITITDVDSVGAITKIELIHGEDVTNVEDLTARELTNLLSNNDYTLKVTYTYDLNDGVGDQTLVKELAVKTEEKVEPTFTLKDVTSDTYTVSGSYEQTNVDNTLISYVVELYKGDELVKENTDKEIAFDSLDYYTEYTVKITYTFDVNDGKGVQTKTVEQKIKTAPYVDVESIVSRSNTALFEGDTIYVQANIINPNGSKVTNVDINGKKYAVSSASTATRLFVEIVCDETLGGGNVELKIDRIYANLEGVSYETAVDSEASATVFINGPFELLKVEFVNERYETIYWHFPDDKVYIKFTFNNPTGYDISKISVKTSPMSSTTTAEETEEDIINLTKINDNEYVQEAFFYYYEDDVRCDLAINAVDVYYENQYVSRSVSRIDLNAYCITLKSNEIKYISTPEELVQAMGETDYDNRAYYKLTADIDLSGKSWDIRNFYGVIDGDGHSIKNYAATGYAKNFGLIRELYGGIINVNMENAFVMVNNSTDVDMMAGMFAMWNRGLIQNCTIDNNTVISVTGMVDACIGGFAGRNDGTIENCTNNVNVSVSIRYGAMTLDGNGTIKNCINNGNITAFYAYGIACFNGTIQDCVNNGNIEGQTACGISYGGTLTNCINNGNIMAKAEDFWGNNNLEAYGISAKATEINCTNNGTVSIQYWVDEGEDGGWGTEIETKTETETETETE